MNIDFNDLRNRLTFEQVLGHYRLQFEPSVKNPDQLAGTCPLPGHLGPRNSKQFSLNRKMKVFQCFSCKASGSILDFIVLMEGKDPLQPALFREVLLRLAPVLAHGAGAAQEQTDHPSGMANAVQEEPEMPTLVNPPLDFALQLDSEHQSLAEALGLDQDTINHFGLGYCSRGRFANRIVAPLHDSRGSLIGYCGIDPKLASPEGYIYPDADRQRDGVRYQFDPSLFLYNGERFFAQEPLGHLTITRYPADVWQLHQSGNDHCVSTMGQALSYVHIELIKHFIEPDNGCVMVAVHPGDEEFARVTCSRLNYHHYCRWMLLEEAKS